MSPRPEPEEKLILLELSIKFHAPKMPSKTPNSLYPVILSFKKIKEITNTIIGFVVIIIEALIGEVKLSPSKKNSWLTATPNNPHTASLIRSFFLIFSLMNRKYTIENKKTAELTLSKIKPEGIIYSGITSLAKVKLIA